AVLTLPALTSPQWGEAEQGAGDQAKLSVGAPDGQTVQFDVQRSEGAGWKSIGHTSAQSKEGKAEAAFELPSIPGTEPHRLRFRAFTADGAEAFSEELRLRPGADSRPQPVLHDARFAHASLRCGDTTALVVSADRAEGQPVRFAVERKKGTSWTPLADASGEVRDGTARTRWTVPRFDGEDPVEVRFRAVASFASAESAAVPVAVPKEELLEAQWADALPGKGAQFAHGQQAVMRVKAPSLDGRTVRFVVDELRDRSWKPYTTVTAVVKGGVAQASIEAQHPSGGKATPVPRRGALRFRAELV
ncbi:MAG: hypothetical protein ACXWLM_04165, partial [Myxococcales bacterium]